MKILFTTRFQRSHKRLVSRSAELKKVVSERMQFFSKDPATPLLKDHALRGKLEGYRAFSIGYDLRALYRKEKDAFIFFDIGTHDQIYE